MIEFETVLTANPVWKGLAYPIRTYSIYEFAVYLYSVCIHSICLFTYVAGSVLDGSTKFTFEDIHQIRQSEQTVHTYIPHVQCLCEITKIIYTYVHI